MTRSLTGQSDHQLVQRVRAGEEGEAARVKEEEQKVLAVAEADGRAEPGKRSGRAVGGQ